MKPQNPVRFLGAEGFPRMEDCRQLLPREQAHHDVYVVWHHAPGQQAIAPPIEVTNRIRDLLSNGKVPQDS